MSSPRKLYLQIFMPGFLVRTRRCWMPPLAGYSRPEVWKKKWDLIERIQKNTEDWEIDKGIEPAINYEHDYIESYVKTDYFNTFGSKTGLDSQLMVDFCKDFASHFDSSRKRRVNIINLSRSHLLSLM